MNPSMPPESGERSGPLRTGLTTGVCATAAAIGAARLALTGVHGTSIGVTLPKGRQVALALNDLAATEDGAVAGVIKDAGDDPDATHGARVWVRITPTTEPGMGFHAGAGVGTVTREGLVLDVGEPAINPVPRRMLTDHLTDLATENGYTGGLAVTVGVDDGERIAQHTMNGRLGILGGLSILGTTGIVRPFSCAAFVSSIHQAVDVARANRLDHVAGCTGSTSETVARERYGLGDSALVEMGDLVGALLKYVRHHPVPRLSLAGGFGKLGKFACGHLDTHSRKAGVDFDYLAETARAVGADDALVESIRGCNTSMEVLSTCERAGVPIAERICRDAADRARQYLPAETSLDVLAVDRKGALAGAVEGV
jgi:cobalt-precorrin-5B (C1)-methyltransferase